MVDVKVNFMKTIIYFVMAFKVTSAKSVILLYIKYNIADIKIVNNWYFYDV